MNPSVSRTKHIAEQDAIRINMGTMYKCPNCGAEMDKDAAKCPFCGYINEAGAEKQYMEKLDDVRQKLDVVDEEAAAEYGKGYKKIVRIIVITVVVLIVLTILGFCAYRYLDNVVYDTGNASADEALKEMSWQREYYPKFDELYDAGRYEELVRLFYSDETVDHTLWEYKHYGFTNQYSTYVNTRDRLKEVDANGWTRSDAATVMMYTFTYYYELYSTGYDKLSDEEIANLEPAREYMIGVIHDRLGYTDADMEALKDRVLNEYGNIEYDKCVAVVKKDMSRYK